MAKIVLRVVVSVGVGVSAVSCSAQGTASKACATVNCGAPPSGSGYSSDAQYGSSGSSQYGNQGSSGFTFPVPSIRFPGTLSNPANDSDCDQITQQEQDQESQLESQHQSCLDQADARHEPHNPNANDLTICTHTSCQGIHDQWMRAKGMSAQARQNADACHQSYSQAQAAKQAAEEAKRKAAEEAEEKQQAQEAAAKKQRDAQAAARQKAQADADAKLEALREEQAAQQQRINQDMDALRNAQAQAQQNQAALDQRTADRNAQLSGLDANLQSADSSADDRLNQANAQVAEMSNQILGSGPQPLGGSTAPVADDGDYALPPPKTSDSSASTASADVPIQFPPPAETSDIIPKDTGIANEMKVSDDPPMAPEAVASVEQEALTPNPSPSMMDRVHDGLGDAIGNVQSAYGSAKATLGGMMSSPVVQCATTGVAEPQEGDSADEQEFKVRATVACGVSKMAVTQVFSPTQIYKTMYQAGVDNVNALKKQLSLFFASTTGDGYDSQ